MDFVVARHLLAARVEHERAVVRAVGIVALQRQGAARQPQAVLLCGLVQKVLNRAVAGGFGQSEFVAIAMPHDAEIFGQHGQLGAQISRLLQQLGGGGEVAGYVGAGDHLDSGNLHGSAPPGHS